MDLSSLRHLAKEILAAATLELFPAVQLIGGEVDEVGFHYDFLFPKEIMTLFTERELIHIEDQMIRIVQEARPIKKLEMMRENAATYLQHQKQPLRADAALEEAENIVSLIQIGSFLDLSAGEFPETTKALNAFKLQGFESDGVVRIYGTALDTRDELKKYLKQCKEAAKRDPHILGLKEGYFLPFEGEWIYLARSEPLLNKLKKIWEQEHTQFEKVYFSDLLEPKDVHEQVMETQKWLKIASYSSFEGDYVTLKCQAEQELSTSLISSLHFFEKVFKIFAFEPRVYCVEPKPGWLTRTLREAGVEFLPSIGERPHISYRVPDGYGRERRLSYLEVERKANVLHRSLFYSPKEWVAHMIEMGVEI